MNVSLVTIPGDFPYTLGGSAPSPTRRFNRFIGLASSVLALGMVSPVQAVIINTNNAAAISAFQAGATIETFDSGLTGLVIASYAPVNVPAGSQFSSRNINDPNVPFFHSGGGSFINPPANLGTPVGVFNPDGAIGGQVSSQTNVIGPLEINTTTAFGTGAFMEVRFVTPISKFGFQLTHGSVNVFIGDTNNLTPISGDTSVSGTIGNFIGVDRGTADIGRISIFSTSSTDTFTIDDLTFLLGAAQPSATPEGASALNLVFAGVFLWFAKRRLATKSIP
jgi:hypothetical protein